MTTPPLTIQSFYKDTCIFLTGGTGFLGTVLVAKILDSLSTIRCLYVLIRPKKQHTAAERMNKFFENEVFEELKRKDPQYFKKVRFVLGDLSLPNLGINEDDRNSLREHVNIVIHGGGTVRFRGSLKDTLLTNTYGTQSVVNLCLEMKKLKSFVYISTLYSSAHVGTKIDEKIYDCQYNPKTMLNCAKDFSAEIMDILAPSLTKKYANNYLFSKHLSEIILLDSATKLPHVCVIRPSIIQSSWIYPLCGWLSMSSGGANITSAMMLGIFKNLHILKDVIMDVVPVDVVADTVLTAAWHNNMTKSDTIKIYNCTVNSSNSIYLETYIKIIVDYAREYPSKKAVASPNVWLITNKNFNRLLYYYFLFKMHFMDIFLAICNKKACMVNAFKMSYSGWKDVDFVFSNRISVSNTNFRQLIDDVRGDPDENKFCMDTSKTNGFEWNEYLKEYILGIRKYILKENIDAETHAHS